MSEVEAESSALEMAQRCGERVEVLAARTERTQTFAEPTGVMTWESALMTERVKRPDGSWAAVDLTLREVEGGQLAPVASPVDMRFSPGGEGPFAEWHRGGHVFTLTWPGVLPSPEINGSSVTYRSVRAGVDLVVMATLEGFRHVLVVHTEAAARDLADVRYQVGGDVTPTVEDDGGLTIRAGSDVVASAPNGALMWDAGYEEVAGAPRAGVGPGGVVEATPTSNVAGPGSGATQVRVPITVADQELRLEVPSAVVESETTIYPLYVDPDYTDETVEWAYSTSNDTTASIIDNLRESGEIANAPQIWVGREPTTGRIFRGYLRFSVAAIQDKHILSAKVDAVLDHSYKCVPNDYSSFLYKTTQTFTSGQRVNVTATLPGAAFTHNVANSANEQSCSDPNVSFSFVGNAASQVAAATGSIFVHAVRRNELSVRRRRKPGSMEAVQPKRF